MKSLDSYSDKQLLHMLRDGDRKAFESIYKRYWPQLFDAAYKRIKSREIAEEIIQELFTYLWCKRKEIEIVHSFSTYMNVALKYKVFNYVRKEINKNKYIDSVKQIQTFNYAVDESVLYNELNAVIEKEINNLPERCKQVFQLSRNENLTLKEIALKLDISISTVEKQVSKALKILRNNLKDYIAISLIISFFPFL